MLKLCFPILGTDTRAAYETPFGFIVRDHDRHEEPGQSWVDAFGPEGGLLLANDAKYSYSLTPVGAHKELRLTAVRSAVWADHYGQNDRDSQCLYMDIGCQEFHYLLRPHAGEPDWAENVRAARLLCMPPEVVPETFHEGPLPLSESFVSVDCDHVLLETIKTGEAGGIVLRLFETRGEPAAATVRLPFLKTAVRVELGAFALKTLRIEGGKCREVSLFEE